MNRSAIRILVLFSVVLFLPQNVPGVTRDLMEIQIAPLAMSQSVLRELSAGILSDPYDEFLVRPYNLPQVNIQRLPGLSPWPGQAGEQSRYVDFLIGNNGNANVRNGADTLQGMYIGQGMGRLTWGASAAYLVDDLQNTAAAGPAQFSDGEQVMGGDARFAMGYRVSGRMVLGGGVTASRRADEATDASFEAGVGGFFSMQETARTGIAADFGFRLFTGEARSWEGRVTAGTGSTEVDDYSEDLDAGGAVISRFVVSEYDISDLRVEVAGAYNRRFLETQGEMQFNAGFARTTHELDNTLLSYTDDGTITPSLTLLDQDAVTENEVWVGASTLFMRGWTEIFGGARLSLNQSEGATRVDSEGVIVDEIIDDSRSHLKLVMGLRQPLWNERFRLVARARADWVDESQETSFVTSLSGTDFAQTTTSYAFGIETVLNNVVFDLAWLFGGEPAPGGGSGATRQTIDLDRLVFSATFGW